MIVAKDFFNEILERLGWPQLDSIENPTLSTRHRKVLSMGNRALKSAGNIYDWPMLRKNGSIVTLESEVSDVTAGSEQYVTATAGSDIITVDNITFDDTYIGRVIQIAGTNYIFTIESVPSPSELKLHRAWVGDDLVPADAATFIIAMERYALPDDFDHFSDKAASAFLPLEVEPVDPSEFARRVRASVGITLDEPIVFTVYDTNDNQTNQLIHFFPYPKHQRILAFDYQRVHPTITSNNDKILFADSAVVIMIDAILELLKGDAESNDQDVARVVERFMRNYNQHHSQMGPTRQTIVLRPDNQMRIAARRASLGARIGWPEEVWDRAEDILP